MATIDVTLPQGVEVDIYADPNVIAAGITTSTAIIVQNKGLINVVCSDSGDFILGGRNLATGEYLGNASGDGFNCLSKSVDGLVSVGEA